MVSQFSRLSHGLRYSEDIHIAAEAGYFLEREMQGNGVEDLGLHTRSGVEDVAHGPLHAVVVAGLCPRAVEDSKSSWEKEEYSPQDPAEAVEQRQVAHHQAVEVMRLLLAVLLEMRLVPVAVQTHHTEVCLEAHLLEQRRQVQRQWSKNC